MIIGGWQKFSLLDYPEHIAAIIFTQGCNFHCPFCYNPMLVEPNGKFKNKPAQAGQAQEGPFSLQNLEERDLFVFLKERQGKLDAVVISGGEPTIQPDLPDFMAKIKDLGYKIKLDTNGSNPDRLQEIIRRQLVDYLAMDIKAPLSEYDRATGVQPDINRIRQSIALVKQSRRPYEFRTTVVPGFLDTEKIEKIGAEIKMAEKWFLQSFQPGPDLVDRVFANLAPLTAAEMEELRGHAAAFAKFCQIR
ncbi:anaerobic ribonucleoside-triphosphate reductase activating protein [Candidatus Falkowbacteria bacterium CG_4_10_14_0_2_um_filter_48_10]|uniref:Anaerobic ribonucleoside-triphosphate reductase activating protein n=1 Tax=Candidatus Falkowbacteria bacterium CG23_combo_of_CG06-09_8_20_14_all_49_15 TaxID=1974572 RepID=A0A2G9ZLP6_9BACT|nr:MAG: anaerobic ribonucleoside-triphosphate reductase activating protein [Candidatus Falkowbacteria bacterium CG23_combo_of_CG06-09_8_20_14_all_49_15]PJA09110.1 MAG: anaerobic ribonucleoside-triphosphate reductase activating protein [Candidatus Falkowbacteria bacterium CG_4_10_14_0_2_um_filter_48_10]